MIYLIHIASDFQNDENNCYLLHSATVTNLQAKVEALTTTNALMKEDISIAHANMQSLQEENAALKRELRQDSSSERMDEVSWALISS